MQSAFLAAFLRERPFYDAWSREIDLPFAPTANKSDVWICWHTWRAAPGSLSWRVGCCERGHKSIMEHLAAISALSLSPAARRVWRCGRANDRFLPWFIRGASGQVHFGLGPCTIHLLFGARRHHTHSDAQDLRSADKASHNLIFTLWAARGGKAALVLYLPVLSRSFQLSLAKTHFAGGGVRERLTKKHISDSYYTRLNCITLNLASSWSTTEYIHPSAIMQTTISFSRSDVLCQWLIP